MTPRYVGRGDKKVQAGWGYDLKVLRMYNFLNKNGFYQLTVEDRKNDFIFIQKIGNIIREVTPNNVKKIPAGLCRGAPVGS